MEVQSVFIYELSQGVCILLPVRLEVLVSRMFTCANTHHRHISGELDGSEHSLSDTLLGGFLGDRRRIRSSSK